MIYQVIVDISNQEVDRVFDYGAAFEVPVGSRVLVPFGRQKKEGFVIGIKEDSSYEVRDIERILDAVPPILPEMLELARYLKRQNIRYIDSLRLFIPAKLRGGKVRILNKYLLSLADGVDAEEVRKKLRKGADMQAAVLDALKNGAKYESELSNALSASAIRTLASKGFIKRELVEVGRMPVSLPAKQKEITLTDEQRAAVDAVLNGQEGVYLIHGVTGSGKTEVYMTVIERMLAEGKTAIMLVPEISLTPQMLGVFRLRFGDKVGVLHSGLSDGERYDEWRRLRMGEARVALGARSAVFAPVQNLGAIIIDEEHDASYVSEGNPRYFTADIAQFRIRHNKAKLIMGSATPSLESYLKACRGEYHLITLCNRVNKREMPVIETVDMRRELRAGNTSIFSRELLSSLEKTLSAGNQAMVFLNRRGFASFVRCRSCGYVARCRDCEVSLTFHKDDNTLKCHYCGKQYKMIDKCPVCGFENLKEGRTGTEKVVEELQRIFPKARILRMDNDTTKTKDACYNILSSFGEGKADILVGTQMIAKGHDFSNVTLVGILDADLALYYSDYRSNERTFQLITQVAGRAGREQKSGRVIMQTTNPNHYVFRYASRYDYKGFFEKESNVRETTKFPPYTRIVRLLVLSKKDECAITAARKLYETLSALKTETYKKEIIRVQAMRAPIKRICSNFRFQVVVWVSLGSEELLMPEIYKAASEATARDVTVFTEINPQQML
jgi:primosomal protein N' (replication factor Y)